MITYREIAEYMLHLIQDEGKMDAQCHIGTFTTFNGLNGILNYFGAKSHNVHGCEIKQKQRCFYIYYDTESYREYMEPAFAYFSLADSITLKDAGDQSVAVFPIAPEIKITYEP